MIKMPVGSEWGQWTVLSSFYNKDRQLVMCQVRCTCGHEAEVPSYNLRSGRSASCKRCAYKLRTYAFDEKQFKRNRARVVYRSYRYKAVKDKLPFDLTEERFAVMVQSPCFYCGAQPQNVIKATERLPEYVYSGIDRMNDREGYTFANAVPCCWTCNRAKSAVGYSAWNNWVHALAENLPRWGVGDED